MTIRTHGSRLAGGNGSGMDALEIRLDWPDDWDSKLFRKRGIGVTRCAGFGDVLVSDR
jgi:hypothetical protein